MAAVYLCLLALFAIAFATVCWAITAPRYGNYKVKHYKAINIAGYIGWCVFFAALAALTLFTKN